MPKPILLFISHWQTVSPCYGSEIKGASVRMEKKWCDWLVGDVMGMINHHVIITPALGLSEDGERNKTILVKWFCFSHCYLLPFRKPSDTAEVFEIDFRNILTINTFHFITIFQNAVRWVSNHVLSRLTCGYAATGPLWILSQWNQSPSKPVPTVLQRWATTDWRSRTSQSGTRWQLWASAQRRREHGNEEGVRSLLWKVQNNHV